MTTISLAMIVKNEGDTIDRVLACVSGFCDELIVVDTGSSDDTVAKALAHGALVHHFDWIDDFAAARNFSFSKCTSEWILWLDGDDLISEPDQKRITHIKAHGLDAAIDVAFFRYASGTFQLRRERLIRRALFGSALRWNYSVHECIEDIDLSRARFFDEVCITHATPEIRYAEKEFRNLNILRRQFANGERAPHVVYHYVIECINTKERDEAIAAYEAFAQSEQPDFKRRSVYSQMADLFLAASEYKRAEEFLAKTIAVSPARAEGYFKMGAYVLNQLRDPHGAIPLLTVASQIPFQVEGLPDPAAYGSGPAQLLARAYFLLEDIPKATAMAELAIKLGASDRAWLTDLASYTAEQTYPSLNQEWTNWIEECLSCAVKPWEILRVLKDSGFTASTSLQSVRISKERGAASWAART